MNTAEEREESGGPGRGALQALYASRIGQTWRSSWLRVEQAMIDRFAEATGDRQFIHIDPERAALTPFGGTVAHGFLTLSLLPRLAAETPFPASEAVTMSVNYGLEGVRFVSPVRSDANIRGVFTLQEVVEKRPGQLQLTQEVAVEIEGAERPALVARWIGQVFGPPP